MFLWEVFVVIVEKINCINELFNWFFEIGVCEFCIVLKINFCKIIDNIKSLKREWFKGKDYF